MADKKGLERIGIAFGLVTAVVVLTATMVVRSSLEAASDSGKPPIISASISDIMH